MIYRLATMAFNAAFLFFVVDDVTRRMAADFTRLVDDDVRFFAVGFFVVFLAVLRFTVFFAVDFLVFRLKSAITNQLRIKN